MGTRLKQGLKVIPWLIVLFIVIVIALVSLDGSNKFEPVASKNENKENKENKETIKSLETVKEEANTRERELQEILDKKVKELQQRGPIQKVQLNEPKGYKEQYNNTRDKALNVSIKNKEESRLNDEKVQEQFQIEQEKIVPHKPKRYEDFDDTKDVYEGQ